MKKILKGIIAGVLSISCMMLPVDVENTTLGMSKVRAAEDDGYQVVDFDASDSMEGAVVTKNGSLYMWGRNTDGEVGDNTTIAKHMPTRIMGDVKAVEKKERSTVILKTDGSIYTNGSNRYGDLGISASWDTKKLTPTKIMSDVKTYIPGSDCAAIKKNGDLYTWGGDSLSAMTGQGSKTSTPPKKLISNAVKYKSYKYYTGALSATSNLYLWGTGENGQMKLDDVADFDIKDHFWGVLKNNGDLFLWGDNSNGQIGNGTNTKQDTPVKVMSDVASFCINDNRSAAIKKDGSLYMWGENFYGEIGNGNDMEYEVTKPVKIMNNVKSVSLFQNITAVITKDDDLYMFGNNNDSLIGNGQTMGNQKKPVKILSNIASIELSINNGLALSKNGEVYTWGFNYFGQLGNGTKTDSTKPIKVLTNVKKAKLVDNSVLALMYTGELYAWGENVGYLLGNTGSVSTPSKIVLPKVKSLSQATMSSINSVTYTGKEIKPSVTVKYADKVLLNNTDYTIAYKNNTNAGNASVIITGKGNFTGSISKSFVIKKRSIEKFSCTMGSNYSYSGGQIKPSITIKDGTKTLKNGTDYTVSYGKNTALGKGTVKISGKGNYTGSITKTFTISKRSVTTLSYGGLSARTYTGKAIKPSISVKYGKTTLKNGRDYTVSYGKNISPGKGTVKISGKGNYTGSITKTFTISKRSVTTLSYSSLSTRTYTGKAIKPSITVKYGKTTLKNGRDYTLSYGKNVATGKGNYSGTITKSFKIVPKKPSVSIKAGKGSLKVTAKATGASGYQIAYATSAKGKLKYVTSGTSKTLKLSRNKTYYVKVRAYKTIDGKKYYGSYSSMKPCKTK